jgi:uncharacterized pyridoxamine 5'-phosphate oxidase family protein
LQDRKIKNLYSPNKSSNNSTPGGIMVNLAAILKANPVGVFATQHGEKIKTRVFQYLFADEHKVYFCTSSDKPVYEQMQNNQNVSFCSYPQDFAPVLSLSGKAIFTEDLVLKEYETFSYAEGTKRYRGTT